MKLSNETRAWQKKSKLFLRQRNVKIVGENYMYYGYESEIFVMW